MHYWSGTEENKSVLDVLAKYDDYIAITGDEIVTRGYIGEMFPKIARELESLGFVYSKDRRMFTPLLRKESDVESGQSNSH